MTQKASKISTWMCVALAALTVTCTAAVAAGKPPAKGSQMTLVFKEHSRHHVPEGPTALGQMTFTEGDAVSTNGAAAGTYNTRKIVIELTPTKLVIDNLVYVSLPNGTLTYMGVTSTAPDYAGPPVVTRPIVGGTGDYAGARGVVKTSADPNGIRVEFIFD